MLHFGKWNWGNSTKKYYGKFEKMAFRKSHEKGVEAQKFFPIERKIWGRTTPKMKFLLKFLALPEGGGVGNSCKNCRNRFFRTFEIFNSKFTAGSLLKIFGQFLQFLQIFPPPPPLEEPKFWEEISFSGSFDLRFFFKLERISELRHPFRAFSKSHFFELSVNFFPQIR